MAAFPGLPKVPFIVLGAGVMTIGWRIRKQPVAADPAKAAQVDHDRAAAAKERLARSPSPHRLEHSGIHAEAVRAATGQSCRVGPMVVGSAA